MSKPHLAYLNLGSNIQPEASLPKAVELLSKFGEIKKLSSVWESEAIGTEGPNYLNVCLLFRCAHSLAELKEKVVHQTESALGRVRTVDKFAARTLDVDIILFDGKSLNDENWSLPFIVIPLAEIFPEFVLPSSGESIKETATRLRQRVWIETRQGVLD